MIVYGTRLIYRLSSQAVHLKASDFEVHSAQFVGATHAQDAAAEALKYVKSGRCDYHYMEPVSYEA